MLKNDRAERETDRPRTGDRNYILHTTQLLDKVEFKTNSANSKLAANVCHEIHRKPSVNTHYGLFSTSR